MNIQGIEIGQIIRDQDGVEYMVIGLDCVGLPRKPGPLVVLGQIGAFCEYRHVNAKELEGFQWTHPSNDAQRTQ